MSEERTRSRRDTRKKRNGEEEEILKRGRN
jgi:hypothetical protein